MENKAISDRNGEQNNDGHKEEKSSKRGRINSREGSSNPLDSRKKGTKPGKTGRRDLRDLVQKLGLAGTPKSDRKP